MRQRALSYTIYVGNVNLGIYVSSNIRDIYVMDIRDIYVTDIC